jgi:hypothetical protein
MRELEEERTGREEEKREKEMLKAELEEMKKTR